MQYVTIHLKHSIRDIIPYSNAVTRIRKLLSETAAGEYVEDDMAIDGGDAEAVLCGPIADTLYGIISPALRELSFLHGAKVTFVDGSLAEGAVERSFELESDCRR